jgi:hypothetical protein
MLTRHLLGEAAIARHRIVCEAPGGDPAAWEPHMNMIGAVQEY